MKDHPLSKDIKIPESFWDKLIGAIAQLFD
jgi:hypothetical protein